MTPDEFEAILRMLEQMLLRVWESLTPAQRREIEREFLALWSAIAAARQAGAGAARAGFIAILEQLRVLLAALIRIGALAESTIAWHARYIAQLLAGLSGEGTAAGAAGGASVAAVALAILAALVAVLFAIYRISSEVTATAPPPVGGAPCGSGNPVATGLTVTAWSFWGGRASWEKAIGQARSIASGYRCSGVCATGRCRGNVAVQTWDQLGIAVATRTTITFDVYCECF
jgi:hypothetical protein